MNRKLPDGSLADDGGTSAGTMYAAGSKLLRIAPLGRTAGTTAGTVGSIDDVLDVGVGTGAAVVVVVVATMAVPPLRASSLVIT